MTKMHDREEVGTGISRFRVPGGWIYETVRFIDKGNSLTATFVPMPSGDEYDWNDWDYDEARSSFYRQDPDMEEGPR